VLLVEQRKSIICIQSEHQGVLESCTHAIKLNNSYKTVLYFTQCISDSLETPPPPVGVSNLCSV
jgi:hypothetical protein